jgi:hypothetical protein
LYNAVNRLQWQREIAYNAQNRLQCCLNALCGQRSRATSLKWSILPFP